MSPRRIKTYTAQTGFVYEYYFVGKREALAPRATTTEYIFDVSSDRKVTFSVSVFLSAEAVAVWSSAHGRTLSEAERYAAVKMRLLRGFDDVPEMMKDGRSLTLDASSIGEFLGELGVE